MITYPLSYIVYRFPAIQEENNKVDRIEDISSCFLMAKLMGIFDSVTAFGALSFRYNNTHLPYRSYNLRHK